MAKLARLMLPDQPYAIEPEKFAASGRELSGEIPLKEMFRLTEVARIRDEKAEYRLRFNKTDKGVIQISGEITATLMMQCQRCLNDMALNVEIEVKTGIIKNQDETGLLPDELEPYLAEDKRISLQNLIEEEILLSLPISALHDEESCPASEPIMEHRAIAESPFAVLKKLKKGKQNQE